jgi:hydroxymethylpyrimidine/phosphomethylpyrimidine kinase
VALTIAGSDSGGGAGIQADLKTMEALGAFGTSVLTAVTAQNTRGVDSTHVLPLEEIRAQLEAVLADFELGAVKTGMLATAEVIELVADRAPALQPLVVDPVMVAATGDRLLAAEAEAAYESLIAEATLVTPNADEAAVLTGVTPEDEDSAREAGEALVGMGAGAALVKGGHVDTGEEVLDLLVTGDGVERFGHPRVDTEATHGSGCTLASAVAAELAAGADLRTAVGRATDLMARAVRYHHDVGERGAVHHLAALRERADRDPTAEAVAGVVAALVRADAAALVPEAGLDVAGATPYAETTDEVATVEGRVARMPDGIRPNRGVRFGTGGRVARFLLAAREHDPDLRFCLNARYGDDVAAALDRLDWTVAESDRAGEPGSAAGGAVERGVARAFEAVDGTPDAVVDRGAVGTEPTARLLAADAGELRERALALADVLTDS